MTTPKTHERTLYEARLDADYEVRLQELHQRLFGRLNTAATLITLLAGTTAFAGVLQQQPQWSAWAGVALAALALVSALGNLGARAEAHRAQRRRYLELLAVQGLDLDAFDAELLRIGQDDPPTIEALRVPAFNANLQRHGRTDWLQPVSLWQRVVHALA